MPRASLLSVALLCVPTVSEVTAADPPVVTEESILPYVGGVPFGFAREGDVMAVGDPMEGGTGTVDVYERTPGGWVMTPLPPPTDLGPFASFGVEIAISGPTMAVSSGESQGAVHVYDRVANVWTLTGTITKPNPSVPNTGFPSSLALEGDRLIVGASKEPGPGGAPLGAAHVFVRSAGTWSYQATLTPSDADPGAFGVEVALSPPFAAVSAPYVDVVGMLNIGAVYVYEDLGGTWVERAKCGASDAAWGHILGWSLELSDSTVFAGAQYADVVGSPGQDHGAVYVFERQGSTWIESQKLVASEPYDSARFGKALAVDGDRLAVTEPGYLDGSGAAVEGRVSVYVDTPNGWFLTSHLRLAEPPSLAAPVVGMDVAFAGTEATVVCEGPSKISIADFDLTFLPFGAGCPGSNGPAPSLTLGGDPSPGGTLDVDVAGGLPNAAGLLFLGLEPANVPTGTGCSLLVAPVLPVQLPLVLATDGSFHLTAPLPAAIPSTPVTAQAWVADPASAAGYANSGGVRFVLEG